MAEVISAGQWLAVRDALRDIGARFIALVRSVPPTLRATRHWTVADTVAHVTSIALWDAALLRTDPMPYPWNVLGDRIRITDVDTVDVLNAQTMRRFSERDITVLTDRLRDHIDDILRLGDELDPDSPIRWLGESHVPVAGLVAHLTNELQIHGRDIARASRAPWTLSHEYAAQFLDLFVVGVTRHGVGQLLYKPGPANTRRVAVDVRSEYTNPVTLVLDGGRVSIDEPGGPVDVRLRIEPADFNLMMFGRISKARAVCTGKVVIGGPHPWLLPTFLHTVRFPA
ncbi:maleylpyruvate isomerase family mycothiol-dependent enzyme [Nocardia panacis]|uniref:Maleylpyruvate isomerase family mycothiol-dependent enzyme n=1 Tax=Nocardia panacis TaxID=2340916 RepID=A0A3A4JP93_9NOCA|nr:maleylpyruvate isomerase family mycothiol-dependent enzyme [Nocardia panacis]RJO70818.1 maleylpyruvate isomerase family mycothiol-dependent enzyme [Nocardia panacis]